MRTRFLVPTALVAFVAAIGVSFFASAPPARAQSAGGASSPPPTGIAPALTTTTGVSSPPSTVSLAEASVQKGHDLFQANCASCHGATALGSSRAPNLQGLGAATVDFWVSTGRMPLSFPAAEAPVKKPRFNPREIRDIVKYVTSLAPGGPGIPNIDLKGANMGAGFALFATNCAGCHGVTGVGDALSNGLSAPSLYRVGSTQVAEAMRTGPGNMPRFGPGEFTQQQIYDIVDYVVRGGIQQPYDKGGHGLGHIGPITEGFVALFIGLGGALLFIYWVGDRVRRAE
ncbi:MAG: cytochrome bc1 complex diheme cytochrome c subunit [Acidimicrobiales bacterium]